jgi:ASC-1-like (ASCH) protein
MNRLLAIFAVAAVVLAAAPATAADDSPFTARRAGPMKLGITTIGKLKKWFGEPDAEKKITRGCFEVWRVRWGNYLRAFAITHPKGGRRLTETRVQRRTITSSKHGDLTMRTKKGLKVGDKVSKLKKLYPNFQKFRLNGKNFYELKPVEEFHPRLWAIGREGRVRALINRPYEYC